jgi:hypothetical protein
MNAMSSLFRTVPAILLLTFLLFPTGTAWAATVTNPYESNNTAQTGDLRFAVDAGGTVNFLVPGVTFNSSTIAVSITQSDTTIMGSFPNVLPVNIGILSADLLGYAASHKDATASAIAGYIQPRVNAFALALPALTYITSNGDRKVPSTGSTDSQTVINNNKWLIIESSGLSLQGLHFRNVKADYTYATTNPNGGGVVNGLIGNLNSTSGPIRIDRIDGNAFSDIEIAVHGEEANEYLAGGGVIGLRSTSDSASMDYIMGNVFRGITITTDNASGTIGQSAYIEGGGIIGVDGVSSPSAKTGSASIGVLANNLFTDITVQSKDILLGGGLVGLNNNSKSPITDAYDSNSVKLGGVARNIFGNGRLDTSSADIQVLVDYSLRGGGVIGLNGLSTAAVELTSLTENIFAGILVDVGTWMRGGGIVGLQTNESGELGDPDDLKALLNIADGNLFLNLRVEVGDGTTGYLGQNNGLEGGGIIGVRSNKGLGVLNSLTNNIFKHLEVSVTSSTTSHGTLDGGGIVGVSSKGEASIPSVGNNYFDDLTVNVAADLTGGGILGASSETLSILTSVTGNTLRGLNVTVGGELHGGGMIGVNTATDTGGATHTYIATLNDNNFIALDTKVTGEVHGGGIVGGYTANGSASGGIGGGVISDNYFNDLDIEAGSIHGGGIVGFDAAGEATADIDSFQNNRFYATRVATGAGGIISGGGIVGAHAYDGVAGSLNISGNIFGDGIVVEADSIQGGGIVGFDGTGTQAVDKGGSAYIGLFQNNRFYHPTVTTAGAIIGGGVLGVHSKYVAAYISRIHNNIFWRAVIEAGTYIDGGGIVGATGTTDGGGIFGIGSIEDSLFIENRVTANTGNILGGLVYSYGLNDGMTISNSEFFDNTFTVSGSNRVYGTVTVDTGPDGSDNTLTLTATSGRVTVFRNNRIIEGSQERTNSLYFGGIPDPASPAIPDDPESNAALIVDPQAGGAVFLYDPIEVNQTDSTSQNHTFAMNVQGAGEFFWGGDNVFTMNDVQHIDANAVTLHSGSTTTILPAMTLTAVEHNFLLEDGGRLNVMGWGYTWNNVLQGNRMDLNDATLSGHLHFNLMNNTNPSAVSTSLNDKDSVLLKINTPSLDQDTGVDMNGATVSLSNFAAGPALHPGDEFYLMDTGEAGNLAGAAPGRRATARQGLTREYDFLVDDKTKLAEGSGAAQHANRWLVARLEGGARPAGETRILSEGRAAGLAFLIQGASWLPDHSYRQADLALQAENAWTPFGGIDGAYLRTNTDADIDISATNMLAGLAIKRTGDDASILFGGFFDAGWGNYNIGGEFGSSNTHLDGDGYLRYYGGGLLARLRWHNGFRLEGSFRAGALENKFRSKDFTDVDGKYADYEITVPYVAAHAGLGYEWKIAERHTLDLLGRYYWTRQGGATTTLDTGEDITFDPDNSHRVRAGARYTYDRYDDKHLSFYVGAAYEYEFDHKIHAHVDAGEVDVPSLTGPTGIGEIGMIIRPYKDSNFAVELGVQGYTGKRKGASGGIRLGLEF